ncbi:MAG: VCBS repeat-containing protein [Proteobacteria bacterium]|nr:VCBS repeat-containing protein [Pseudomonadota bacterium]
MSKGDPDKIETIWLSGSSRGGGLTWELARRFVENREDFPNARIMWGGFDAVLDDSTGEGCVTTSQRTNPWYPWPTSQDWQAFEVDLDGCFDETEELRLFQVVGGHRVLPGNLHTIHGFGVSPQERGDDLSYRQAWVPHGHGQIGQLSTEETITEDTIFAQLDQLETNLSEFTDDQWALSDDGDSSFRVVDQGRADGGSAEQYLYGDFDSDGDTDVMKATGKASTGLQIAKSNAGTSFDGWSAWQANSIYAGRAVEDYAVGDFDGDGRDDVLLADGGDWHIRFSGITAAPSMSVGIGASVPMPVWQLARTTSVSRDRLLVGDIDGDGDDDLVRFASSSSRWYLHLSNGTRSGTFTGLAPSVSGNGGLIGDVDGDGRDEVVRVDTTVLTIGGLKIYDYDVVTTNLAIPWPTMAFATTSTDGVAGLRSRRTADHDAIEHLIVCDFTGDGRDDLVVAWGNAIRLAQSSGGGSFDDADTVLHDIGPHAWEEHGRSYAAGNFDGDGDLDLMFIR